MILADLFTFLGRLHPMVVHLPIGFLLLGVIFDLLTYFPKYKFLKGAVPIVLLWGFIFASIACVFGYMLSLTGGYDNDLLASHKLTGILLAMGTGLLWSTTTPLYSRFFIVPNYAVTAMFMVIAILLTYTGHMGSSLTRGSEYISLQTLQHQQRPKPVSAEEALIFEDVVLPVLDRRCGECHRQGKRKGGLRLDTFEQLMKGGKNGPVVTAGNAEGSEMYRRITLDAADEDFMPSDGKTPLTKTEIEVIRWWIAQASATTGKKVVEIATHESVLPLIAGILKMPGAALLPNDQSINEAQVNAAIPPTTDMAAVESLRSKGVLVRMMLHLPVMLDVALPAKSHIPMQEITKDLTAISANVIWLNLSDNNLTSADLAVLKQFVNLEKLRLEKNKIGDEGIELFSGLTHLEAVNLNETNISNEGVSQLRKLSALKRIYIWKTPAQPAE